MVEKLVYDVGMHEGEDTEFYLSRGCRVVGIEANPELVPRLRARFKRDIEDGRVRIVDKAIARSPGKVRFAIDRVASTWGTISDSFVERNAANGSSIELVEVEAVTFADVLREFGVPYYLKIDIEGMDMLCIEALHSLEERPRFISLESCVTTGVAETERAFVELAHLCVLGYRRFKYVNQVRLDRLSGTVLSAEGPPMHYAYRQHSSGPFGDESPGRWQSIDGAVRQMRALVHYQNALGLGGRYSGTVLSRGARRLLRRGKRGGHQHYWYDLHATQA